MLDGLHLDIEGFGLINEAKIEIGKINVVGGVNASGKSTASKLLYCFLKAMSLNRKDYILETILPTINEFVNCMVQPDPYLHNDLPDKYSTEDKLNEILLGYFDAKDKYKKLGDYFTLTEILDDMEKEIDTFIPILLDQNELGVSNVDNFLLNVKSSSETVGDFKHDESFYKKSYSAVLKLLFKSESLLNFEGNSSFYNDSFNSSVSYEYTEGHIGDSDRFWDLYGKGISKDQFDDFDDKFIYFTEGSVDFLNDVFYIDSISTFDLDYYLTRNNKRTSLFQYKEHIEYLLKHLKDTELKPNLSNEVTERIDEISDKICEIVGGHTNRISEGVFSLEKGFYFVPDDSDKHYFTHISSGIQQISLIQILLSKYKLYPGCFLILDEPEVNLHPKWQFKFAEILVILAKELDITIYLNSHSPTFIESIDAFSEYYDMQDDINYYLTEESEINGKFNFNKINSDELYKIYNNLGNIYDDINKLRIRKRLKNRG